MFRHALRIPARARRRAFTTTLSALLLATTLGGCGLLGGDGKSSSAAAGPLEKSMIKVALLSAADLAPLRLAQESGYFKAEGLDVEAIEVASGQAAMTKMISGEVDIAFSSYMPFFIAKSKAVADIRIVADSSSASPRSNVVVTVPSSPVKTIKDLAGKRIAISDKNTASHLLTTSVMRDHGVDTAKVEWVPMQFPSVAAALQAGDVDAAFLPEPFLTQAAKVAGAYPVADVSTGATQDFPLTGFGALGSFVDRSPRALGAFQRGLSKAVHESADRAKIEPLLVKYAKIDQDTAALTNLPAFGYTLDARRLQRVPDLLLQSGVIPTRLDVTTMLVDQAG